MPKGTPKVAPPPRPCQVCGAEFAPPTPGQMTCGPTCKSENTKRIQREFAARKRSQLKVGQGTAPAQRAAAPVAQDTPPVKPQAAPPLIPKGCVLPFYLPTGEYAGAIDVRVFAAQIVQHTLKTLTAQGWQPPAFSPGSEAPAVTVPSVAVTDPLVTVDSVPAGPVRACKICGNAFTGRGNRAVTCSDTCSEQNSKRLQREHSQRSWAATKAARSGAPKTTATPAAPAPTAQAVTPLPDTAPQASVVFAPHFPQDRKLRALIGDWPKERFEVDGGFVVVRTFRKNQEQFRALACDRASVHDDRVAVVTLAGGHWVAEPAPAPVEDN